MIKKIYDADETDFVGHHEKPICSQLIYEFRISDTLLNTTLKSVKKLDYVKNHNNLRSHNGFLFKENEFLDLKNFCLEKISSVYQKYYDSGKIQITQSWANKSDKGQWHHPHRHPNSLISMILYLTDSDACTWFSVKNIWYEPFSFLNIELPEPPPSELKTFVIHKEKTTAGKLVIFPSVLYHSVDENNSIDTRYTISCNTFIEGDLGNVFDSTYVDIPRV
tara:strand:+ start:204 stop:866 length:663 start_codon:yes stop_codon:yes gene_type:complete